MVDHEYGQVVKVPMDQRGKARSASRANKFWSRKTPKPYKFLNKRDSSFVENKTQDAPFTNKRGVR